MDITENEIIRRISRFTRTNKHVIRGIGDDCAVAEIPGGTYVFTQDALVEGVHFTFDLTDPFALGEKAIYVNISDILSMGAEPLYFLVTMAIPADVTFREISAIYRGISRAADRFGALLIGGDTVETKKGLLIDISMIGRLVTPGYLGRNGAHAGDLIAVTGELGESAYGLYLLKNSLPLKGKKHFVDRYRRPVPPHDVWKELIKHDIPNAMMDISDGLLIDLGRMMAESGKAAIIEYERIPIPGALVSTGNETLALGGGEDYQFLFTFPPDKKNILDTIVKQSLPVSIIGKVTRGRGVRMTRGGKRFKAPFRGYEHFGTTQ